MTKEEFGLDLFEAIKCIGGLLALQEQINGAVHHGKNFEELVQRRDGLKARLIPLMQTLDPADVTEILRRYPMVGML